MHFLHTMQQKEGGLCCVRILLKNKKYVVHLVSKSNNFCYNITREVSMLKDKYSTKEYFNNLNQYFMAANYLSAAQLYLLDNPLLKRPLKREDIKPRIVGHWGTVPGQNFVYAHCNRVINKYDLNMMLISGPGHGGNFFIANSYLEGVYSEIYKDVAQDEEGLKKLFKQFSYPGGTSSHVAPEVPGSIHEGGELGYSLVHAYGAVLDNPNLIVAAIVGDGEAETGPLATSWHCNKLISLKQDGAVLPILHLNGYKISNPTILARMKDEDLLALFKGYGYQPVVVAGDDPQLMHRDMAKAMDWCIERIKTIWQNARSGKQNSMHFPMIILRTPKGWTGPKELQGKKIEGSFRAHQVPVDMSLPQHVAVVEKWLKSYHPETLFVNGKLKSEIAQIAPKGNKRISANPNANGGKLLKELKLPSLAQNAVKLKTRGGVFAQDMFVLGGYLKQVYNLNPNNFRIFGPDEALSNRLSQVFDDQKRAFGAKIFRDDEFLSADGRVMDAFLSEHVCEGMLESYVLTGRHGVFDSYEAFARIVDSMVAQHSKWLKTCSRIPWRADVASLNIVLTSHAWQQDHNGFTHQDTGFLDHLNNKGPDVARIYLPADANTLVCTMEKCLKTKNKVNAIVASKHPTPQWLSISEAKQHVDAGLSVWDWACTGNLKNPDVVLACAGNTPTLECLAAVQILGQLLPDVSIRFVNVVDLMKLMSSQQHPHGLDPKVFDQIFTKDKPIVFNFHGYPKLIHSLMYKQHNQDVHVRGYIEEGSITTPFDMRVQNGIDRFSIVKLVTKHLNISVAQKQKINKLMDKKLADHKQYITKFGVDMPEVTDFVWRPL